MKILMLGSGYISAATVYYCLTQPEVTEITVVDANLSALQQTIEKVKSFAPCQKLKVIHCAITSPEKLVPLVRNHTVIAAALPWPVTKVAIIAALYASKPLISITRPDYADIDWLKKILDRYAGSIVLGCGLEPGLTEIMTRHAIGFFSRIEELHVRCGGIVQKPCPPLNYKILFNGNHLPFEARSAYLIENGVLKEVPRFSAIDSFYSDVIGWLEAWHDGMLPWLIELPLLNQARLVTQKTLRWPGFAALAQLLNQLGFLNKEAILYKGQQLVPQQLVDTLLEPHARFNPNDRDISILQINAHGYSQEKSYQYEARIIADYDEDHHFTAMARITGYTLAITTLLFGQQEITYQGLLRPENIFINEHYQHLQQALEKTGIRFSQKFSDDHSMGAGKISVSSLPIHSP